MDLKGGKVSRLRQLHQNDPSYESLVEEIANDLKSIDDHVISVIRNDSP